MFWAAYEDMYYESHVDLFPVNVESHTMKNAPTSHLLYETFSII